MQEDSRPSVYSCPKAYWNALTPNKGNSAPRNNYFCVYLPGEAIYCGLLRLFRKQGLAGNLSEAFRWLNRYVDEHCAVLVKTADPRFDPIPSDPCFIALLKSMNFPR